MLTEYPFPPNKKYARLLLENIRYGITVIRVLKSKNNEVIYYVRSPEHLYLRENTPTMDAILKKFKRDLQLLEENSYTVILKRAPYKNDFDDWDDEYASMAYEEYKVYLMCRYEEADLI